MSILFGWKPNKCPKFPHFTVFNPPPINSVSATGPIRFHYMVSTEKFLTKFVPGLQRILEEDENSCGRVSVLADHWVIRHYVPWFTWLLERTGMRRFLVKTY